MKTEGCNEVEICMGSACFARGNRSTAEAIESFVKDNGLEGRVRVRGTMCEGKCRSGPHVKIAGVSCTCHRGEVPKAISAMAGGKKER